MMAASESGRHGTVLAPIASSKFWPNAGVCRLSLGAARCCLPCFSALTLKFNEWRLARATLDQTLAGSEGTKYRRPSPRLHPSHCSLCFVIVLLWRGGN